MSAPRPPLTPLEFAVLADFAAGRDTSLDDVAHAWATWHLWRQLRCLEYDTTTPGAERFTLTTTGHAVLAAGVPELPADAELRDRPVSGAPATEKGN